MRAFSQSEQANMLRRRSAGYIVLSLCVNVSFSLFQVHTIDMLVSLLKIQPPLFFVIFIINIIIYFYFIFCV